MRNQPSTEFSTASMADIVFLLLIYFLLTSTYVAQSGLKVDLPTSSAQKPSDGKHAVTITADGQFAWDAEVLQEKEELIPLIQAVMTDPDKENDVITLRTDKAVTMEQAAFVISEVARYGGKIVISTKKE